MFEFEVVTFDTREKATENVLALVDDIPQIGNGCYARVYAEEKSKTVVKVIDGEDLGYLAYLKVIQGLGEQAGPYAVRVQHVRTYQFTTPMGEWDQETSVATPRISHTIVWLEKLKQPMKERYDGERATSWDSHPKDPAAKRFTDAIGRIMKRIEEGFPVTMRKKHWDLIALLNLIQEERGKTYLDLHHGNVMLRNGHFVITDPMT